MKVKSLLTAGMLIAALTASAEYPIYFRDCGGAPDGDGIYPGHFSYPMIDGDHQSPAFAEDGSITLTRQEGGGCWFRTKKLTEACPMEYCVLAYDYKSSLPINDVVVFHHEYAGQNAVDITQGVMYTVSDDYQTVYLPFDRSLNGWGSEEDYTKNYLWISTNDANGSVVGWTLTVKNIRMLTLDEAAAECAASDAKEVADVLLPANADFTNDADPDMDNCPIFAVSETADNPMLQSAFLVRPLPSACTTFAFEYKLVGEAYAPSLHLCTPGAITKSIPAVVTLEACEDPYAEDFKTAKIDLKDAMEEVGLAKVFGSKDYIWLQFQTMPKDNVMWIKNARWIDPTYVEEQPVEPIEPDEPETGITGVEAANAAAGRVYNMMGVEVKGELAPGLYIRDGKKFIVK